MESLLKIIFFVYFLCVEYQFIYSLNVWISYFNFDEINVYYIIYDDDDG